MTSTVLEREAVIPARARWDLRRGLRQLAAAGAVPVVALTAAWYGHQWWTVGRFIESTDDAYVGGDITVIAPKVAGFISEVAVADNQVVKAGDLLLRLDDRDYQAALDRATATVAAQQAALANLDATRQLQEAMVAEANADIAAADAEVARSEFDLVRYRKLASNEFASLQRLQQADADHKQALAAADRARATLTAAARQLAVIDTQKQQAQAALAEAQAGRRIAELNLSYTEIRAPIDGAVGDRSARVGAFATVGANLMSLVPARGLWIDANFKEDQLAAMRPGQPVSVAADVLPGEVFSGHVKSLAPGTGAVFSVIPPENATGNFTKIVQRVPVRIALDDGDATLGALRPGLSTTVRIDTRPGGAAPE